MGGGDIWFSYDPSDEPLVDAFVAHARRTAKRAGLLRFRTFRHGGLPPVRSLEWDGRSWRMGLAAQKLQRDLPVIAEAVDGGDRSLRSRKHLAHGFCEIFGLEGYGAVEGEPPHLRPMASVKFQWVPHLLSCSDPWLDERLFVVERHCVDWHFGDITAATLVEELHTAAELLLRFRLGDDAPWKFSSLVHAGAGDGHFPSASEACLLELSRVRRDLRHHATGEPEKWLVENFEDVVDVLIAMSDPE